MQKILIGGYYERSLERCSRLWRLLSS
jgi:hypothetical protein